MAYYPPVSPYAVGMAGKCPRCGQGDLFEGYLGIKAACDVCGLDYAKADSGDGPAVFVIFIVGFAAVVLAIVARYVWWAPIWAAFLISGVGAMVMILGLLRPLKATLIAVQFQHKAEEGRLEDSVGD